MSISVIVASSIPLQTLRKGYELQVRSIEDARREWQAEDGGILVQVHEDTEDNMLWAFRIVPLQANEVQTREVHGIRIGRRVANGVWIWATSQDRLLHLNGDCTKFGADGKRFHRYLQSGAGQQNVIADFGCEGGGQYGARNFRSELIARVNGEGDPGDLILLQREDAEDEAGAEKEEAQDVHGNVNGEGDPGDLILLRFAGITREEMEQLGTEPRADGAGGKIKFRQWQAAGQEPIRGIVHVQTRGGSVHPYAPCDHCFDAARQGSISRRDHHDCADGYRQWMQGHRLEFEKMCGIRGTADDTAADRAENVEASCFSDINSRNHSTFAPEGLDDTDMKTTIDIPADIQQAINSASTIQIDDDGHIVVTINIDDGGLRERNDDDTRDRVVRWCGEKGVQFLLSPPAGTTESAKNAIPTMLAKVSQCGTKVHQPTEFSSERLQVSGLLALAWSVVEDLLSRSISRDDAPFTFSWEVLHSAANSKPAATVNARNDETGPKAEAVALVTTTDEEPFWVLVLMVVGVWRHFSCYFKGIVSIEAQQHHQETQERRLVEALRETRTWISQLLAELGNIASGAPDDLRNSCDKCRQDEQALAATFEGGTPQEKQAQREVRKKLRQEIKACNRKVRQFLLEQLGPSEEEKHWLTQILYMLPPMPEMQTSRVVRVRQGHQQPAERRGMPCTNGAVKATSVWNLVMDEARSLRTLAEAASRAMAIIVASVFSSLSLSLSVCLFLLFLLVLKLLGSLQAMGWKRPLMMRMCGDLQHCARSCDMSTSNLKTTK
eukprot:SAG11_NODE_94_length_17057_cov_255.471754_5_plen_781_part_00